MAEILERSRPQAGPSPAQSDALARHLAECPRCAARWESEVELSRRLRAVRVAASPLRSPDAARDRVLAAFDARRREDARRPGWGWSREWGWASALAAAVVLVLALAIWKQPSVDRLPAPQAKVEMPAEELIADNDFVPVPYAPPLAPGEFVEVVRVELSPAALARMGFITQAGYGNEVTTDMVIGEDGLPRAVRVPESVGIQF